MILEKLTLTDFRVFRGQHTFDLEPRVKYGKTRPIILYGGLNGAGKTTTLTAIRLALYGKQSIGKSVAKNTYDDFLKKSIYSSGSKSLQPVSASIELTFSYANMGVLKHYAVNREWMINGKSVIENLSISENGKQLSELNDEQCQGFLNELIPIGVSDLFFFDSEKIAELAEDTGGVALGEAIKKLLGLDLLDTLSADLTILLRNENKSRAAADVQKEIKELEDELSTTLATAEDELQCYENLQATVSETSKNISKLEHDLSSRGGAWAATREKEYEKQANLTTERTRLEKSLRETIEGSFPISLAPQFIKKTLKQLELESDQKKASNTHELISKHVKSLEKRLKPILSAQDLKKVKSVIEKEFNKSLNKKDSVEIIHDISESILTAVKSVFTDALEKQHALAKALGKDLDKVNDAIDKAGRNIARAPEESTIQPIFTKIHKEQERRTKSIAQQKLHIENRKRHLRAAMDLIRKLDNLSATLQSSDDNNRTIEHAFNAKNLLEDFSKEMAKRKIHDLENEFITSFHHLARKEDISMRAEINPTDFSVKLINNQGLEIDKDELSAGEKQIYAIAILEALARTSGRKLPIIIDTPLARLDSVHRTNLIRNYFPYASHQVIILSTDTEVDEEFYDELSSHISHAYKLNYSSEEKCTFEHEGYFWKSKQREVV